MVNLSNVDHINGIIYFSDCRTSNNWCRPEELLGLVLRWKLPQGQCMPSHLMKIPQVVHRLWP